MRAHLKAWTFLGLFVWASVGNTQPPMFVAAPPGQGLYNLPQQAENAVVWNAEIFQMPARHQLTLRVPGRKPLVLVHDKTVAHTSGNRTWVGHVEEEGEQYRAVITVSGQVPHGGINTPTGRIELRSRGNFSILADTATESATPLAFGDDVIVPPMAEGMLLSPIETQALALRAGKGQTIVDILVLYNTEMANLYADVDALIDNLVVLTNTAYEDSGVNMAIRVVYKQQITYEDEVSNLTALASDFQPNASAFADVESLRTSYGADLAVLMRPLDAQVQGGCGIAYLLGSGGTSLSARYGYAVVSYGKDPAFPEPGQGYSYCSDYALAHELGHNMGSAHDRGVGGGSTGDGHYPYSHGYGNDDPAVRNGPDDFGTVMSYYSPQIGRFSNPDLACTTNFLCGVDEAVADAAHNVLSLNNTRETIAGFRASVIPDTFEKDDIGIHRNNRFYLDANGDDRWQDGVDANFVFGLIGDTPITGDWNGDGIDEIGIHRSNRFFLDVNGDGRWETGVDTTLVFGLIGDTPITGDWNGDGVDEIGIHRHNRFFLDVNGDDRWETGVDTTFTFGIIGDTPITGDWNGDGVDEIGIHRHNRFYLDVNGDHRWETGVDTTFTFGIIGDTPITGDWNGDGIDEIGIHRNNRFYLDVNGNNRWDIGVDTMFGFGLTGDTPLAGRW